LKQLEGKLQAGDSGEQTASRAAFSVLSGTPKTETSKNYCESVAIID
jgi:hypothetical protein